jgi:hypothetical protein
MSRCRLGVEDFPNFSLRHNLQFPQKGLFDRTRDFCFLARVRVRRMWDDQFGFTSHFTHAKAERRKCKDGGNRVSGVQVKKVKNPSRWVVLVAFVVDVVVFRTGRR